jgi:hypothetical protein
MRWTSRRYFKHLATMPAKLRAIRARKMHDDAQAGRDKVVAELRQRRALMETVAAEFLSDEERGDLTRQKSQGAKGIAALVARDPAQQH